MAPPEGAAKPGRYWISTWGCQMNVHDSEKIAGALHHQGYEPADRPSSADVVLLNTCAIREKASEKMYSELGRLRALKEVRPEVVLGVCGCVAQHQGEAIRQRAPHVDLVVGARASGSIPVLVEAARRGTLHPTDCVDREFRDDSIKFPFERIVRRSSAGKAFVTVIEGCNHRCSYCVVPQTRGREVCRPLHDILAEVRSLTTAGVVEVEFLGQTVNAYRDAQGNTLADLLRQAAAIDGLRRIHGH